ncbi:MAG: phosphoglycerate dehydrogenase [Alphaproteobacteria bacterium]|nr:phosphoglycerate dehydrogenase [Alphaproteobacteria bacterium]
MPKVLIADKMDDGAVKIFEENNIDVDVKVGMSKEELIACIADYNGLVVRSSTKPDADVIASAPKLKVIGRAGIGVDNVDVKAATKNGVIVMNTPFGNSITTAEHAIAMIMAVARRIPQASESTHAGKWEKSKFMGAELFGKTLGVIGCGNIGSIAASLGVGLKMKVIAFDPYLSEEKATKLGVEKVEIGDIYARADFITLHTPLLDSTRGMINKDTIAKMKKGVRIVNCARGGLIVEEDLKEAIESGHVAGAGLDVYEVEPAKECVLFGMEEVVCTPHLGASTKEAQQKVALQVAEQISEYLNTGGISNAINAPSVSADEAPKLKPYMTLCSQIGRFAGQTTTNGLKSVNIEYTGCVSELNTAPLTALVLDGLLSPLLENVNKVNAKVVAEERGIEITETKSGTCKNFFNQIKITVVTEKNTRTVAGTLINNASPRIVEVNGVGLEAELTPNMLYIRNMDEPGAIASICAILAAVEINIATISLGRTEQGGKATVLFGIDAELPSDVLDALRKLPCVVKVMPLSFEV